jgi:hypothetical protein
MILLALDMQGLIMKDREDIVKRVPDYFLPKFGKIIE